MADTAKQQRMEFLYQLLAGIQTPEDMAALLEDLCTRKEVENMAERVFAARLLLENNTYAQVMEQAAFHQPAALYSGFWQETSHQCH